MLTFFVWQRCHPKRLQEYNKIKNQRPVKPKLPPRRERVAAIQVLAAVGCCTCIHYVWSIHTSSVKR